MKKVIASTILAVLVLSFSSFTSVNPFSETFHEEGTENFITELNLCNGGAVLFELTLKYTIDGKVNKNRAVITSKFHATGIGTNPATGEVYTLDGEENFYDNYGNKGAFVLRY